MEEIIQYESNSLFKACFTKWNARIGELIFFVAAKSFERAEHMLVTHDTKGLAACWKDLSLQEQIAFHQFIVTRKK